MFTLPSRYVLQHTTLDAEAARVELQVRDELAKRQSMTLLIDGWEDLAGRSLYGTVISGVEAMPIVLGLSDLTGKRGTADALVDVCVESMKRKEIDVRRIAALCTDDPTVMRSARSKIELKFPWILVSNMLLDYCRGLRYL